MAETSYLAAIRESYDRVAEDCAELVPPRFAEGVIGRSMLGRCRLRAIYIRVRMIETKVGLGMRVLDMGSGGYNSTHGCEIVGTSRESGSDSAACRGSSLSVVGSYAGFRWSDGFDFGSATVARTSGRRVLLAGIPYELR